MFKKPEISKVIDFNQFMLWFSYIIFIDSYLIMLDDKNIFSINFDYIKIHLGHIPVMIVMYMFSMSVMSFILQYLILILKSIFTLIHIKYFDKKYESTNLSGYMTENEVMNSAIIKNNSVLYNQYSTHKEIVKEILIEKKIASGLVFLCLINYFSSTNEMVSILKAYELLFDNHLIWYVNILNIVPISVIVYILIIAFKNYERLNYIHIDENVQIKLLEDDTEK
jgi:hypothetical protein